MIIITAFIIRPRRRPRPRPRKAEVRKALFNIESKTVRIDEIEYNTIALFLLLTTKQNIGNTSSNTNEKEKQECQE